ncbi:MAG: c-type cytochrome [Pseudomonadota bacterium]|nr:c-type cytochrome [Pseudomonadota bacterium]
MTLRLSPTFAAIAAATATVIALTALPVRAQAQAVTGDVAAGATKVAMCIGCHGIQGYQSSFPEVYRVPMISGQSAAYIAAVLHSYQKGDRKHPSMRAIAGSMDDQDIADVAAFYQQQGQPEGAAAPELPAAREPSAQVAQLLQKGACVSCHGANFSTPIDPSYPKIAGQHADYLYVAMRAYRDNTHATWGRGNPVMAGMVKQFSNAELKAMAQYIGSLPGGLRTVPQSRFR